MVTEDTVYHVGIDFGSPEQNRKRLEESEDFSFNEGINAFEKITKIGKDNYDAFIRSLLEGFGLLISVDTYSFSSRELEDLCHGDFEKIREDVKRNSPLINQFKDLYHLGKYNENITYRIINKDENYALKDRFHSPSPQRLAGRLKEIKEWFTEESASKRFIERTSPALTSMKKIKNSFTYAKKENKKLLEPVDKINDLGEIDAQSLEGCLKTALYFEDNRELLEKLKQ